MLALYALVSVFYWVCLYMPLPVALQPVLTIVDFAPRWLVFTPLIIWLAFAFAFAKKQRKRWYLVATLTLLNLILVIDVQLPSLPEATPLKVYRVATFNAAGSRADMSQMVNWYQQQQLDALLLQEARAELIRPLLSENIQLDCFGQLCVMSQHSLTRVRQLNRELLNGYGTYAAHYALTIDGRTLQLVNLHLNTPRHGLQMLKAPRTNYRAFLRLHADMEMESMIASQLTAQSPNMAIIGGDFNQTQQNQIYRRYWQSWQNSFQQAGTGLGYTKSTRWHGVRIDHILLGQHLTVLSSEVHAAMGSDHKPLLVEFTTN